MNSNLRSSDEKEPIWKETKVKLEFKSTDYVITFNGSSFLLYDNQSLFIIHKQTATEETEEMWMSKTLVSTEPGCLSKLDDFVSRFDGISNTDQKLISSTFKSNVLNASHNLVTLSRPFENDGQLGSEHVMFVLDASNCVAKTSRVKADQESVDSVRMKDSIELAFENELPIRFYLRYRKNCGKIEICFDGSRTSAEQERGFKHEDEHYVRVFSFSGNECKIEVKNNRKKVLQTETQSFKEKFKVKIHRSIFYY